MDEKKRPVSRGKLLYPDLSYDVVGAAMKVHRVLGNGILEKVYESTLCHKLDKRRIPFEAQCLLKVNYKGKVVGDFVADIVVDQKIILELKAVKKIHRAHMAQTRNYLVATGYRLGIVFNFGADSLQYKRVVN